MASVKQTGFQKFSLDTQIPLYNGTYKTAHEVHVGDILIGDDNLPRVVEETYSGTSELFEVTPQRGGSSFVVTGDHPLRLKMMYAVTTGHRQRVVYSAFSGGRGKRRSRSYHIHANPYERKMKKLHKLRQKKFEIIDITVRDLLQQPKCWQKFCRVFQCGTDWPLRTLPMDPYILGVWLGDGTASQPEITNTDHEIVDYLQNWCDEHDMRLSCYKRGIYRICQPVSKHTTPGGNLFLEFLKTSNLRNNKHIPEVFLLNDRANRLALLAGLLDTDGSLDVNKQYNYSRFRIVQKRVKLADQIEYLARSLGFRTHSTPFPWKDRVYQSVTISGNIDDIPTLVARKQAQSRVNIKEGNGFKVLSKGVGAFCGIRVRGNRRMLVGDFWVT